MSLLFNMLSLFAIAFLPRSKCLNFMATVTVCSDFGVQENKVCRCFHCLPHQFAMKWWDQIIFVFWMLSFKPAFSLSIFTFIKRLFSSSLLSAIKVVSSIYLRLLIFPPAILIPTYDSFSLAFYMTYWTEVNFPNSEPVRCSMSITNGCFLSCIQVSQEASKVVG